jgi:hypothetical protein
MVHRSIGRRLFYHFDERKAADRGEKSPVGRLPP